MKIDFYETKWVARFLRKYPPRNLKMVVLAWLLFMDTIFSDVLSIPYQIKYPLDWKERLGLARRL